LNITVQKARVLTGLFLRIKWSPKLLLRGKSGLSGSLSRVFTYDSGLVHELQTTNYKLQARTLVLRAQTLVLKV